MKPSKQTDSMSKNCDSDEEVYELVDPQLASFILSTRIRNHLPDGEEDGADHSEKDMDLIRLSPSPSLDDPSVADLESTNFSEPGTGTGVSQLVWCPVVPPTLTRKKPH